MDLIFSDEDLDFEVAENELRHRLPREFNGRSFNEDVSDNVFREQYRVPRAVLDFLETRLKDDLQHYTKRNKSISVRFQIMVFLHFIGTNVFFHVLRDCHGISTNTIYRIIHSVGEAIFNIRQEIIKWPNDCSTLPQKFMEIGGFPCVCGVLDGSHILLSNPPQADEDSLINRHHVHSINAMAVCGPDTSIFYASTNSPGRWHDAHVLRNCNLWNKFEIGELPFNGAVILADSAYPCREWLIPPFPGDPDGAQKRFNIAQRKTRNIIERCFGIVKNRFYALKTGIRLHKVEDASKLIMCGFVIHNLCIRHGDNGNDFEEREEEQADENLAQENQNDRALNRRLQLLNYFT
ncbi:putative nuclease HARBI1 [Hydra vulgaris]